MIKEINFKLEKKDLKNFSREHLLLKRNFLFQLKVFALGSLCFGVLMSVFFSLVLFKGLSYILICKSIFFLTLGFFIPMFTFTFLLQFFVTNATKTSNYTDCNIVIDSETDAVKIKTENTYCEFKWNSLFEIQNKKHNILLYTTRNVAIIIPKRIFNSEEEISELWNLISDCYKKAKL